jgi:hypothetical protein
MLDQTLLEHVGDLVLNLILQQRCIAIRPDKHRLDTQNQGYEMVTVSARWQS